MLKRERYLQEMSMFTFTNVSSQAYLIWAAKLDVLKIGISPSKWTENNSWLLYLSSVSLSLLPWVRRCTYCCQSFYPCLVKIFFSKKSAPYGRWRKINICFAVNALLEFLSYWFYRASVKETVAPRFYTEVPS